MSVPTSTSTLSVTTMTGPELRPFIPDLARLRAEVFRDFPYLYDSTPGYEETYLQTYLSAPDSLIVLACDGTEVVGASTALPLVQETPEIQAPFQHGEYDPSSMLYLGESVLLPQYRGRGLGHAFFDHREAHAQKLGLSTTTFCAVYRPDDHPLRPAQYRTLHAFWAARGYVEHPELTTHMTWKDLDQNAQTPKLMRFWVKAGVGG